MTKEPKPTWAARIPGGLDPSAWSYLHSLPRDRFLWWYDVMNSMTHVSRLEAAEVLSAEEAQSLMRELERILESPDLIDESDEDVHSAIERVLTERLGDLGAKIHAGRSRNDQVATAMRHWISEELIALEVKTEDLIRALTNKAEQHAGTLAPGYTHLQRAQPISLGHWLCAHAWALIRDVTRVRAALESATRASPLGAGALATSTLGLDPDRIDATIFSGSFENSIDAVADRDFLLDSAYAVSVLFVHISRLAEEIILWSTEEFGFIKLPDSHATGSSMMPQKKNPDVAELARGQTGVAVGALTGLLVTLKGLPFAYNRDLQADKQLVSEELFTMAFGALDAMSSLVDAMDFDVDRMVAVAADPALRATDVAEDLVRQGVPFREAHERVATMVREGKIDEAVQLNLQDSVVARSMPGGPSPESVRRQVERLRATLEAFASYD